MDVSATDLYGLAYPTLLCALISFGLSARLFVLTGHLLRYYKHKTGIDTDNSANNNDGNDDDANSGKFDNCHRLIANHLNWLCIYNMFFSLWALANFGSIAFSQSYDLQTHSKVGCSIVAFLFQFGSSGASIVTLILIATMTHVIRTPHFPWLNGDTKKYKCLLYGAQSVIIIGCAVACIAPYAHYGESDSLFNSDGGRKRDLLCWIASDDGYMIVYGLMIATMIVAMSVALYVSCCVPAYNHDNPMHFSGNLGILLSDDNDNPILTTMQSTVGNIADRNRLVWFAIALCVPSMYAIIVDLFVDRPRFWMVALHHCLLAISPSFYFFVWVSWDQFNTLNAPPIAAEPPNPGIEIIQRN